VRHPLLRDCANPPPTPHRTIVRTVRSRARGPETPSAPRHHGTPCQDGQMPLTLCSATVSRWPRPDLVRPTPTTVALLSRGAGRAARARMSGQVHSSIHPKLHVAPSTPTKGNRTPRTVRDLRVESGSHAREPRPDKGCVLCTLYFRLVQTRVGVTVRNWVCAARLVLG